MDPGPASPTPPGAPIPPSLATPPGPRPSRGRKLAFATLAWLALAVLLEGGVRIRERILYGTFARAGTTLYVPSSATGHELKAGADVSGTRMKVHVNSLGFRGPEVAIPKPPGKTRVVCVGASTTFDILAASDEDTWPARLERKLRVRHPEVEVVNAGVAGYTIDSFLAESTWDKVRSVGPDVVVAYFATNEVSQEARNRFDVARLRCSRCSFEVTKSSSGDSRTCPRCGSPLELVDPARPPGLGARALKELTDWSLFAYKVWLFVDARTRPADREGTHELPEEAARSFEEKLHELVRRTRAAGARPALATFALRWRADQPSETKHALAAGAFNIYAGLSLEGIDRAFAQYNDAIVRVARAENATLLPVAEKLAGQPGCYGDFVHFSSDGSERMADIVAEGLESAHVLEPERR